MPEPGGSTPAPRSGLPPSAIPWIIAALYLLLPALLILPAVGSGQFLYGSDLIGGLYAQRVAVARAFAEGRLPTWEPHVMAGHPLLAASQGAVFYPPTWLLLALPAPAFCTWMSLLHLALAGIFARAWLRRGLGIGEAGATAGGFLFLLSSFVVSHLHQGHVNHVWAYPWVAALLWRVERYLASPTFRRGVLIALALAMLFLTGAPAYVFYLGLALGARVVHFVAVGRDGRKDRARIAAGSAGWAVLGMVGCAPQLLPTLELVGEGQRAAIRSYEFVTSFSVAPANLLTLVAPAFFGDGREAAVWSHGAIWESSGFVGIAGLGLAALGAAGSHPQRRFWAGVGIAGLLLSLGRYSPVFGVFYHLVPGAGMFRVTARYLILFTLAATALAALGVDRLWKGEEKARRQGLWIAAAAAGLMLAAGGLGLSLQRVGEQGPGWWLTLVEREKQAYREEQKLEAPPASLPGAARSLLWAALCSAAVAGGFLVRPGMGSALALSVLLLGELWVYNSRFFVGSPTADLEWPSSFIENVRNHPRAPFRIATVAPEQTPLIGKCMASGLDHLGGYDPMMLRRYTELVNVARGKPATDLVVAMVLARPNPLFDLLGARYWIVPGPRREPPGWKAVGELPSGVVYENPSALPRAFLVGRAVNFVSDEERLRFLASPEFDARRMVVTERDSGALPDGGDASAGRVALGGKGPGRYEFVTESPADAYLVLSEAWFPGWTVKVDGSPGELLRANHLMQTVRLAAGKHEVRFEYHSTYLNLGWGIAFLSVLLPAGVAAARRKRKVSGAA